jgi:hypothetical protein
MLFARAFDDNFTKDFMVVHWDQRHSGKAYRPYQSVSDFSLKQITEDGLAVVDHLKKSFTATKLFLSGTPEARLLVRRW